MSDAAAHTTLYYAMTKAAVGEDGGAKALTRSAKAGYSAAAADYRGGHLQR